MLAPARLTLAATLTLSLALVGALTACVGYSGHSGPKEVEDPFNNPNVVSSKDVAATALEWVIKRYPPTGEDGRLTMWREFEEADTDAAGNAVPRLAINLGHEGVRQSTYDEFCRRAGRGAVPLTPETESLPIYHVGRVWVEGDMATVDIFRPVVPWPDGSANLRAYQAITVRLRGGMKPWGVVAHRVWGIGATTVPGLVYYNGRAAPTEPDSSDSEPESAPPPASTPEKFDEVPSSEPPSDLDPIAPGGG